MLAYFTSQTKTVLARHVTKALIKVQVTNLLFHIRREIERTAGGNINEQIIIITTVRVLGLHERVEPCLYPGRDSNRLLMEHRSLIRHAGLDRLFHFVSFRRQLDDDDDDHSIAFCLSYSRVRLF
jgi:hypothetical protein